MHTARVSFASVCGAVVLSLVALTPAAAQIPAGDDPPGGGGVSVGGCGGQSPLTCVNAHDKTWTPPRTGTPGGKAKRAKASTPDPNAPVCTSQLMANQPPPGSEVRGNITGTVYQLDCAWRDGDPNNIDPGTWDFVGAGAVPVAAVDPAVVARQAVDSMLLKGPEIGITPKPGGKGVVGMPVYLWTAKSPETYGPNVASATAGAVTVTATARVSKIVWEMGDGQTVTCTTAGTPYQAEFGKKPSPDCGHQYRQPSSTKPGGKYHVKATSTWTIDWQGAGLTGQLTEVRDTAVDITVVEVQVLN